MIKTLYYSLKIDVYYAINSFIFLLRKIPFLNKVLNDDSYNNKIIKIVSGIIGVILSLGKSLLLKFVYYSVVLLIANTLSNNNQSFYHVLFFLSLLGMFLNNHLLNAGLKKYLSVILFKMDAKNYLKYNLFWISITNIIFNTICLFSINNNLIMNIIFILLLFNLRFIGESFNLYYFRKKKDYWYNNSKLYLFIIVLFISLSILPFFNILISNNIIVISSLISSFLAIISYIYFNSFNDYKVLLKRINTYQNIMNNNDNRQKLVDVKDKDISINSDKLKDKNGYDYFNTIFFERHKDILYRSSRNYSLVLLAIYILIIYLTVSDSSMMPYVDYVLNKRMGIFLLVMYFINRGSVVTQAMFYNCDHAMLKYNFYREPKVITGLFKRRLSMVSKINLLPAIVICIGNCILLYLIGNTSIINYMADFLFIIILSIFFSVHYLVIYYLLQPYDKDLKIKRFSYSIASIITYYICFNLSNMVVSSIIFSVFGLIICIIYIFLSLFLINKYAYKTFKIR